MNILVTGGLGFIGSNFLYLLQKTNQKFSNVINLDLITYSANMQNLNNLNITSYKFYKGDINNQNLILKILLSHEINVVINFAAESHVDRSILNADDFMHTNINGTYELLKACNEYKKDKNSNFKFIHISTDEVYGSLSLSDPAFQENSPYAPNSPYAASKAASDLIVRSYIKTFGFPAIITNCSNNYGPYQYPEKLIPLVINNCLENKPIPIYGNGLQIRDWLHVNDHCSALLKIIEKGTVGEKYNIGGNEEITNLDLVNKICEILNELKPPQKGKYQDLISFVKDRPGHDTRYAINNHKIQKELRWKPIIKLKEGLKMTIEWYLENENWLNALKDRQYHNWIENNYQDR